MSTHCVTAAKHLALRTVFLNKNFALSSAETSPSSIVSDLTRRLDLESARYSKLLGTLPGHVDVVGLQLTDADLLLVLMKALPDVVKNYVIHHSVGDSYSSYRQAACKWESQQRMFVEHSNAQGKVGKVHEVMSSPGSPVSPGAWEYGSQTEWYSIADDTGMVDAVDQKCSKCGSRKHETSSCQTDVSKLTCFRCSEKGHISANCPKKNSGKGGKHGVSNMKGSQKGKPSKGIKGKFDKGKGKKGKKGKSFGKKGKLNELGTDGWSPEDYWWWSDDDTWWWSEGYDVNHVGSWNDHEWHGSDWYAGDWQDETTGAASQAEPSPEPQKSEQPVGSLVISALVCEDLSDECCFDLEISSESCDCSCILEACLDRCCVGL